MEGYFSSWFSTIGDVWAMIKVKQQMKNLVLTFGDDEEDLKFCYSVLQEVSRSFAVVIIQLHPELRNAVALFYLVLRGLDTVEDDMDVPIAVKKECLPVFHENLYKEDWHMEGVGKGQERVLLEQFYRVGREFRKLHGPYRDVIQDICHRMALGMCHYLDAEVKTKQDYDMYCHYVAGLVGHGLTRLFAESGLESPAISDDLSIANDMGLFLQKTNIIRDYLEDISEVPPRIFWPREVWGLFAHDLHEFQEPKNQARGLECINALVADALSLVPHCIDYLVQLKEPTVFQFCAIPQVMAIATLAELYNNPDVFKMKVKIAKGPACRIIRNTDSLSSTLSMFSHYLSVLESKLCVADPSFDAIREALRIAKRTIGTQAAKIVRPSYARSFLTGFPALGGRFLYRVVDEVSHGHTD